MQHIGLRIAPLELALVSLCVWKWSSAAPAHPLSNWQRYKVILGQRLTNPFLCTQQYLLNAAMRSRSFLQWSLSTPPIQVDSNILLWFLSYFFWWSSYLRSFLKGPLFQTFPKYNSIALLCRWGAFNWRCDGCPAGRTFSRGDSSSAFSPRYTFH